MKVKVGFCFSFPITKTSPNCGLLVAWTKDYLIEDGIGEDVVKLLQDSCANLGLKIEVPVIINDSVGVLAGGRWGVVKTSIHSMIMGTCTHISHRS